MRKKELRMQISYEANRLANNYLSSAYEKLVPIVKHQIKSDGKENHAVKEITRVLTRNAK
jgi:hypothetical protein